LLAHANAAIVLAPHGETLTISAFMARLRQDSALRQRFADSPAAVLREHGIDPAPYRLPDRMSEGQLDRLLAQVAPTQDSSPAPTPTPRPPSTERPPGRVVLYGPPARPPQQQRPNQPQPPAPVYGPPATPR